MTRPRDKWFRVANDFPDDPKVLQLLDVPEAIVLWLASIGWSSKEGTDGDLPRWSLRAYSLGLDRDRLEVLASRLVAAGLWTRADLGGFTIPKYLEWQETAEDNARRRTVARERRARWEAARRVDNAVDNASTNGNATRSATRERTRSERNSEAEAEERSSSASAEELRSRPDARSPKGPPAPSGGGPSAAHPSTAPSGYRMREDGQLVDEDDLEGPTVDPDALHALLERSIAEGKAERARGEASDELEARRAKRGNQRNDEEEP